MTSGTWRRGPRSKSIILRVLIAIGITAPLVAAFVLVGIAVIGDAATAPNVQQLPVPPGWSNRELETADCSGSGGLSCRFAVLTPASTEARISAEADYRHYLTSRGWTPTVRFGEASFERGARGAETVLVVGSDGLRMYETSTNGKPAVSTDIIVRAAYADEGVANRRSRVRTLVISGLVAVAIPAVGTGILFFRLRHHRSSRSSWS